MQVSEILLAISKSEVVNRQEVFQILASSLSWSRLIMHTNVEIIPKLSKSRNLLQSYISSSNEPDIRLLALKLLEDLIHDKKEKIGLFLQFIDNPDKEIRDEAIELLSNTEISDQKYSQLLEKKLWELFEIATLD